MTFGDYENRYERGIVFRNAFATIVVDGSEQQCSVPTKKLIEQSFYSGKKKKHSITLLAAVAPKDGYIYWISESYQGSKSDQEMCEFPENRFWEHITSEEYIIADKGFRGLDRFHKNICIPFFNDVDQEPIKQFNNELAHYRIIVENVFSAIKKWKICTHTLALKFTEIKDALNKHNKIWSVVAYLINKYHSFGQRI